jgi:hypothetical protein
MKSEIRKSKSETDWLPDMDLNHDKVIQSHLCYRYTIGQVGAASSVILSSLESSNGSYQPAKTK